jgi:hypothetical protein
VQFKFYNKFQSAHPKSVVCQRVFESLKTFFVKLLKDKNTCCCIYHIELNELRLALNLLKTNNLVHDVQFCGYHYGNICDHDGQQCQASYVVYKGITQLWEAIMCPKGEYEEW